MSHTDPAPGSKACSSCGAESPEVARFCSACGTPFADGAPAVSAPSAPAQEEERRPITAVFVDIVGSTSRAERLDPEDVLALLEPYYDRLRQVLERHGGTVEKFIGDAVVALFGAPVAHEDDPLRAVRAGLAVIDAIRALNEEDPSRELSVRVGVTTGEAIVALDARVREGRGMAWGDVLNTAARLQSSAPVDGVLVDERTRDACVGAVSFEEAEPVHAKGKAEPVRAWIALRIDETRRAGATSPLVGREAELDQLIALWDRVGSDHTAGFGLVVAEAGIGKSRLVEEVAGRATADGAAVVSGGCLPYGEGITYWPIAEMLRQAAAILASDDATVVAAKLDTFIDTLPTDDLDHLRTIASALAHLVGAKSTPRGTYSTTEISQAELHWGVRRSVELAARGRPLVLVIEDLHWAEPTLIELVEMLTEAEGDVLVLATCRPEALEVHPRLSRDGERCAVVELGALDAAASEALVEELLAPLLAAGLDRGAIGRLVTNAGGNPLFLEETARMLLDRGLVDAAELEALSVPANVQALVGARLDGLPPQERRLAQRVSVAGGVFWTGAAGYLDEDGVELGLLESLARRGFLAEREPSSIAGEREWEFRHAVIRDVAYGRLPRGRRVALHIRFGDWVEQLPAGGDELVEILAFHLEHACLLAREMGRSAVEPPIDRAVSALVRAAGKAELREGVREASRYYARALALDPPDGERVSIRLRHAATLATLGDLNAASEEFSDVASAARALNRNDLLCEALSRLGNVSMKQGRASEARAALAEAVSLADALEDDRLGIRAKYELSALRADFDGDVESATALLTDGLLRAESAGDTSALLEGHLRLGMVFFNLLHLADAERYLTRCAELASELGSIRDDARATALVGWVRYYRGPIDEARLLAEQAEEWFERTGDSYFRIQNLRWLGKMATAIGADDEAEAVLRRALDLASDGGGWLVVDVSHGLVDVLVRVGKLDEARSIASAAAQALAEEDPYAESALLLAGARLAQGEGRHEDALDAFRRGIALLEEYQLRIDAVEARIAYARALRVGGDTEAAGEELTAAHRVLVELGALGLAEVVERERGGVTSS